MISTLRLIPDKRFLLRIPHELHDQLKATANSRGLSLNRLCVHMLSARGIAPATAGQSETARLAAHNGSLAADHVARAEARLLALDALFGAESWADVVCESQEVVELALRGLMRWAGLDPRPDREIADSLLAARKRLPASLLPELPRLAQTARSLRRDRDLAFHGSNDLTPWEFYKRHDAEVAVEAAKQTLAIVRTHVLG
jgi:HEPN domain-containing protein